VRIPAWTRLDAGLALAQNFGSNDVVWRLGVTNLLDTKAWREAPLQFDHIYLIPMAARTFTASAQLHY
jgi:iron complex outermembrane receptor protein